MSWTYNFDTDALDYYLSLESPLQFKGSISAADEFPTSADVEAGWYYKVTANVTDNDATKTNTGQSFETGDEIVWDGSAWVVVGNENLYLRLDTTNDPLTGNLEISKTDPQLNVTSGTDVLTVGYDTSEDEGVIGVVGAGPVYKDLHILADTINLNPVTEVLSYNDINLKKSTGGGDGRYLYFQAGSGTADSIQKKDGGNLTVTTENAFEVDTLTDGIFSVTGGAITGASGSNSQWTNDEGYITETDGDGFYLRQDGTTPLTGNWDTGAFDITTQNITFDGTLTDGTATLTGGSLTNAKLGSLTNNGFVKTSGGDGTLSVDTNSYVRLDGSNSNFTSFDGASTVLDGTFVNYTADLILYQQANITTDGHIQHLDFVDGNARHVFGYWDWSEIDYAGKVGFEYDYNNSKFFFGEIDTSTNPSFEIDTLTKINNEFQLNTTTPQVLKATGASDGEEFLRVVSDIGADIPAQSTKLFNFGYTDSAGNFKSFFRHEAPLGAAVGQYSAILQRADDSKQLTMRFHDSSDTDVGRFGVIQGVDDFFFQATKANSKIDFICPAGSANSQLSILDGTTNDFPVRANNPVHIEISDTGGTAGNHTQLLVEKDSHCMIEILSDNASLGDLVFSDGDAVGKGRIRYNHSDDSLKIYADSNEAITINSTSDGVIHTKPSSTIPGLIIERTGGGQLSQNGIVFQDQVGGTKGAIGTEGAATNDLQIGATRGLRFYTNSDLTTPTNERMRIASNGDVSIGTTNTPYKFNIHENAVGTKMSFSDNAGYFATFYSDNLGTGRLYLKNATSNSILLQGDEGIYILEDNLKMYFGASDDYSIEWDGSDAVHTITAGDFVFTGGDVDISDNLTVGDTLYVDTIQGGESTDDVVKLIGKPGTKVDIEITAGGYAGTGVVDGGDVTITAGVSGGPGLNTPGDLSLICTGAFSAEAAKGDMTLAITGTQPGDIIFDGGDVGSTGQGTSIVFNTGTGTGPSAYVSGSGGDVTFNLSAGNGGASATPSTFYIKDASSTVLVQIDYDGDVFLKNDSQKLYFGAANDASITYDGTDLNINPREVGSGVLDVSAPIKITDVGSLLGTPQAGTFEFDNDRMYLTNVATQRAIDRTSDVITSTTTVDGDPTADGTTETTIWTGTLGANALKAGNVIKTYVSGTITNASAADDITIRKYIGTTVVETFNPAIGNVSGTDWHMDNIMTVRSVGATGSVAVHGKVEIHGENSVEEDTYNSIETVDTTASQDITITMQWDNADAGNTISAAQGFMEFKN